MNYQSEFGYEEAVLSAYIALTLLDRPWLTSSLRHEQYSHHDNWLLDPSTSEMRGVLEVQCRGGWSDRKELAYIKESVGIYVPVSKVQALAGNGLPLKIIANYKATCGTIRILNRPLIDVERCEKKWSKGRYGVVHNYIVPHDWWRRAGVLPYKTIAMQPQVLGFYKPANWQPLPKARPGDIVRGQEHCKNIWRGLTPAPTELQ